MEQTPCSFRLVSAIRVPAQLVKRMDQQVVSNVLALFLRHLNAFSYQRYKRVVAVFLKKTDVYAFKVCSTHANHIIHKEQEALN